MSKVLIARASLISSVRKLRNKCIKAIARAMLLPQRHFAELSSLLVSYRPLAWACKDEETQSDASDLSHGAVG